MNEITEHTSMASLNGRKVLFVAFYYPPTDSHGLPGSMRTVKFIRHLTGGDCHVLTTPASVPAENDLLNHLSLPLAAETIHRVPSLDIFKFLLGLRRAIKKRFTKVLPHSGAVNPSTVRMPADPDVAPSPSLFQNIKDFIYNICYFPDQAGPWILPAAWRGIKVVRKHNIDVIFATGSPWSGLVAGYLISKLTKKPLILDFRDPWQNNLFNPSKGKMLDRWERRLESIVVNHADAISLNTEPLKLDFLERYKYLPNEKFFVMPNGFDESDLSNIAPEARRFGESTIILCHAGTLYGVRDPSALLDTIRIINSQQIGSKDKRKLVFRQIGSVNLDYDLSEKYSDLLQDGSLIIDPPLPYKACISALKAADMVVNIQPATRSQIPSKLYDYLAINLPILSITPAEGALGQMVIHKSIGEHADFHETEKLQRIFTRLLVTGNRNFSGYSVRDEFDIAKISQTLSNCIEHVSPHTLCQKIRRC